MAGADRVHADAALAELIGPGARERPDSRFGRAINAYTWEALDGGDRCVQDDRCPVVQHRKRLLNREKEALHIRIEMQVVELLVDTTEPRQLCDAGIREYHVEFSTITFH